MPPTKKTEGKKKLPPLQQLRKQGYKSKTVKTVKCPVPDCPAWCKTKDALRKHTKMYHMGTVEQRTEITQRKREATRRTFASREFKQYIQYMDKVPINQGPVDHDGFINGIEKNMREVITQEREAVTTNYWGNVIILLPAEAEKIGIQEFLKQHHNDPSCIGFVYIGSCADSGGCEMHQKLVLDGKCLSSPAAMLLEKDEGGNLKYCGFFHEFEGVDDVDETGENKILRWEAFYTYLAQCNNTTQMSATQMNWTYLNQRVEIKQGIKSGLTLSHIFMAAHLGWMRGSVVGPQMGHWEGERFQICFKYECFRPFNTAMPAEDAAKHENPDFQSRQFGLHSTAERNWVCEECGQHCTTDGALYQHLRLYHNFTEEEREEHRQHRRETNAKEKIKHRFHSYIHHAGSTPIFSGPLEQDGFVNEIEEEMRRVIQVERAAAQKNYWGYWLTILPYAAKSIGLQKYLEDNSHDPTCFVFNYAGSCGVQGGCNIHERKARLSSPAAMLLQKDDEGNPKYCAYLHEFEAVDDDNETGETKILRWESFFTYLAQCNNRTKHSTDRMNWVFLNMRTEVKQGLKAGLTLPHIWGATRLGWQRNPFVGPAAIYCGEFPISFNYDGFRLYEIPLKPEDVKPNAVAQKMKLIEEILTE